MKCVLTNERQLRTAFALLLLIRLLYPFFDSPLQHLFSDPLRHWENGARFLHPDIMGCADPRLYQLWIYLVRSLAGNSAPWIQLACGLLCAAMPYGWYRALRELQPRRAALGGALLIGIIPESFSIYAYFMNETLLLTLMGFCFWLTLRASRKHTAASFLLALSMWLAASLTRTVAVPMAIACVTWLWLLKPRVARLLAAVAITGVVMWVSALHGSGKLGFYAPLGNLYFNEVYNAAGTRDIAVDYGPDGSYQFGSPSFYNPTFWPFSQWTTGRTGLARIKIDLTAGRLPWIAEKDRVRRERSFPVWQQRLEDVGYLLFAPAWPNSNRDSLAGVMTLWGRWLWGPLLLVIAWSLATRRYRGSAYLVPLCAIGTVLLLVAQSEGVMEGRFREPLDGILVAAVWLAMRRGASFVTRRN